MPFKFSSGAAPSLARFQSALAAVDGGTGNCRIFCVGDSTTRGVNADIAGNTCAAQSYPWQLAALIGAKTGLNARANQSFWGQGGMSAYAWGDARITTTFTTLSGAIGGFFRATSAATWAFAPGYSWTDCDIYFTTAATLRFTYKVGAGAPVEPSGTAVSPSVMKVSFSKSAGSETLTLDWVAGDFRLVGVHCYNAADKHIAVFNAGVSGAQASSITSTTAGTGGANWPPIMAPDLVILDFSLNDFFVDKVVATFKSEMQTNITNFKATGADVVLTTCNPTSLTGLYPLADYRAAVKELAAENGLLCVEIFDAFGSHTIADGLGLFSDASHPSTAGYVTRASIINGALAPYL
jgi:lysophospholipase L1-like esterase